MAGCDGWITIKILELLFASFCMIYKRVTDDEANKLFYFLQKFSREWPLLNSITWEENGAIFTNITYGGYIIIIIGLIIGQCSGELQRCRKMENFFLIFGAILFIAAGSLELAALEYVEERLVDNAAILGVFSLITGFLFIIDLLLAGKRRKKEKIQTIQKTTYSKLTQTEETKSIINKFSDMNGNIQNGEYGGPRIPVNGVKLLPSLPVASDQTLLTGQSPKIEFSDHQGKYFMAPPIIDGEQLKTHQGKLKSTESFLRSEKGFYPHIQKTFDESSNQIVVPAGYVLVSADHFQANNNIAKSDSGIGESQTPSDYAKIMPDSKTKPIKTGYVVIPVEENNLTKNQPRKLQSPTITTTVATPTELLYRSERDDRPLSPYLRRNAFTANSSENSDDFEEPNSREKYKFDSRRRKSPNEYLEMNRKNQEQRFQIDNSSEERKPTYLRDENYQYGSQKGAHRSRNWHHNGKDNGGYDEDYNIVRSKKSSSPYRASSRDSSPEKPKSILRFDYGRKSSQRGNELYFPKDIQYDSLDSKKIAEDLKNLKEITSSNIDLKSDLEEENRILKERLRQEKEEREKLKLSLVDMKTLEKQMRDSEEKNRRVSEREEQYFGIKDLKQSHQEKNFNLSYKIRDVENRFKRNIEETGKGAKEMNERLREKHLDENKASKEFQEYRDLIDERFHFLDEEEKRKKIQESQDANNFKKTIPTNMKFDSYIESHHLSKKKSKLQRSDSDEPNNTISTDEEIRLRVETPGSTSFKSEALFWLGNDQENQTKPSTPISPTSPGYVLYTAQNWPESPSPQDRFQFSAKEAQQLAVGTPPKTPLLDRLKPESLNFEDKKNSQKSSLLEFEETPHSSSATRGLQRGLLVRKVDFPMEPKKPVAIAGSTSTWKKWLQPRPKLQHMKSTPS